MNRSLILASTSPYRRELLARFGLPFGVVAPGVEEDPIPGELPLLRAHRLALAKARAVSASEGDAIVIGSDQVASIDGEILDKPGSFENALAQLRRVRGSEVQFFTGIAAVCAERSRTSARVVPYRVRFRSYTDAEIERYLLAEQPYDCAGSARAEGLGIALIEAMSGDDPTALIGLPLIALARLLRQHGIALP